MQFRKEQTDADRLSDQVYAAMETGNTNRARELIASHKETYPDAVASIRHSVLQDYGTQL